MNATWLLTMSVGPACGRCSAPATFMRSGPYDSAFSTPFVGTHTGFHTLG